MKKIMLIPLLILAACSQSNDSHKNKEKYDSVIQLSNLSLLEESSYDFGSVATSRVAKIKLQNDTGETVTLQLGIGGSGFAMQRSDCGATLADGQSCSVSIVANARSYFNNDLISGSLGISLFKSIGLSALSSSGRVNPVSSGASDLKISGDYPSQEQPISNLFVKNDGNGNATLGSLDVNLVDYVIRVNQCEVGKVLGPKQECRIQIMLKREYRVASPASAALSLAYVDSSGSKSLGQSSGSLYPPEALVLKLDVRPELSGHPVGCYQYKDRWSDESICNMRSRYTWINNSCYGGFNPYRTQEQCESNAEDYYNATPQVLSGKYSSNLNIIGQTGVFEPGDVLPDNTVILVLTSPVERLSSEPISTDLVDVIQWGTNPMPENMAGFFSKTKIVGFSATDIPNLSNVTNMEGLFSQAKNFNQAINWNTSSVTRMDSMFVNATAFNSPLNIDTRNVTDMTQMFHLASSFNQDLSHWCVSKISNKPFFFDEDTTSWVTSGRQPAWGQPCQ